jgi:ATP-dependent Clp protease adapter protein ClpS
MLGTESNTNVGGEVMTKPGGYLKVASIGGIPLFVHWSFPVGGVLVSLCGRLDPSQWIHYSISYTCLIIIHEAGHVVAARLLGLKVFAIDISGTGGLCRVERPRYLRHSVLIYSGGLIAQLGVFLATWVYVSLCGTPVSGLGRALVITLTVVNGVLFIINLIPQRGSQELVTDGYVLWKLLLHVVRGHPHPHPPLVATPAEQAPVFHPETRLLSKPGFRPRDFVCGIEVLNDRTTPMEFVVSVLSRHLEISRDEAIVIMLDIHNTGGLLIPLPSAQNGRRVADAIAAEARAAGHPLVCRYVGREPPA